MKNSCHSELVSESKNMTSLPPHPSPLPQGARERTRVAFTLAEVLITLGIIGVVAAMTIPTLMTKIQDIHFKAAYKKAYSDLSQATKLAIEEGEFPQRTGTFDKSATLAEWDLLKRTFKIAQLCEDENNLYNCWINADKIYGHPQQGQSKAFIDLSGRAWALYYNSENVFFVDVNAGRKPNQFGKDRFIFTFMDASGNRAVTDAVVGVKPYCDDKLTTDWLCQHPPCYYKSWLQ